MVNPWTPGAKGNFVQDILTQQMNCLAPCSLLWCGYTYPNVKCTSNIFISMKLFLCGKGNQFYTLTIKFSQVVHCMTLYIIKSSFPDEPCTSKALVGSRGQMRNKQASLRAHITTKPKCLLFAAGGVQSQEWVRFMYILVLSPSTALLWASPGQGFSRPPWTLRSMPPAPLPCFCLAWLLHQIKALTLCSISNHYRVKKAAQGLCERLSLQMTILLE